MRTGRRFRRFTAGACATSRRTGSKPASPRCQRGPLHDGSQFLGGETLGALWDRILPAQQQLRADPDWDCALWVLHGVVNAALLSHWVSGGQRLMLPGWQQNPACINVIDLGADDALLRAVNLNPMDWLQPDERRSTMEQLLADFKEFR